MGRIFLNVIGWLLRKFGLLLLLIAALMLAPSAMEFWKVVGGFNPVAAAQERKKAIGALLPNKGDPKEVVDRKLKALRKMLEQKKTERLELSNQSCYLPTCSLVKDAKLYRVDTEVAIIEQTLLYVEAVGKGKTVCAKYWSNERYLDQLRRDEATLKPFWLPTSKAHWKLKERIRELEQQQIVLNRMCQVYRRGNKTYDEIDKAAQIQINQQYAVFLAKLGDLKQSGSAFLHSAKEVLQPAFLILLGIIFTPIGVKLFAYYGVATLASRKFGVRLLPEASGDLTVASASEYLQRIDLENGEELLVDPALLRSSPDSAVKSTKLLLDRSMPLSSIASGQYLLTRIRGDGTVTMSDSMSKLTVLELPENAALVLQPRCLAGIGQRVDRPVRITRHWRLGNLGSWLTLQLRYVVFHGPVKLIVRGNHGVEADAAQAGSSLNQAATLGFSANLGYGVARCETFYGYLSGKTELFNDCFSSGPGYYVQEVHPRPAKKTLLPGRGIEGILNSLLQVFGL